jgi:hypothetical protein
MLETIELGLGESQELKAVDRCAGMLISGTEGICRGRDVALACDGDVQLVGAAMLQVIRLSRRAFSVAAGDICSYDLSQGPPRMAFTS